EPLISLPAQSTLWRFAYLGLVILMAGCAIILLRSPRAVDQMQTPGNDTEQAPTINPGPSITTKLKWLVFAFVPSSQLLSVTSYLSTDIAAIPLLWVIPLALYLLTFTLVFARRPVLPHRWMLRIFPFAILALTFAMLSQATEPLWLLLLLHLFTFFVVAM